MRRIRLVVAYDGTNYSGWQMQKNATTIESELAGALRNLLGKEVPLIGASRTDAGVHAMGNIAVFDTDSKIPQDKFAIALNHYLPEDIRVRYSDEVTSDYHPRYEKTVKTYEYTVLNCEIALPAWRLYSYHVYRPLNIESMKAAAKLFALPAVRSKVRCERYMRYPYRKRRCLFAPATYCASACAATVFCIIWCALSSAHYWRWEWGGGQ